MSDGTGGGVAIVGLACRFPGAATPSAFWNLLREGRETIRRFSPAELRAAGVPQATIDDPRYVPARGHLEDVERFDPEFFGITVREATLLDPQHRLWLECAWEALEDAGYHGASLGGPVGVFAGCRYSSYLLHHLCADRGAAERLATADDAESYQMLLGNDKDLLAGRTSYLLDLRGPSMAVQTACSSSLVAVAQACQSLLTAQTDLCLAGGACVALPSVRGYHYQENGIQSPDGHCRAFDARARGTVFGDGVGVVLLKRLEDALADRDAIYAVIRGYAVTNDGAGKLTIAAPSVAGQAEAVALAQAVAGVDPRSITYVEAHGTGTALGDPVEVAALTKAFRLGTSAIGFCGLGSVKTNIGHADVAAGVAGLIKTTLALSHRLLPPSLHFQTPNSGLGLEGSPFRVVRRLTPWAAGETPRRAGVSSFGVGGTNCHVVLEEAPPLEPTPRIVDRPRHVLALSARRSADLRALARRYAAHLTSRPGDALADVCFTANTGRARFSRRVAITSTDHAELAARLLAFAEDERPREDEPPRAATAFLFTGQGATYPGMGRELYASQPVFRAALDRCDTALRSSLAHSLVGALHDAPAGLLRRADYGQPALFALQVALAELWRAWGIVPDAVLGHSIGELAAGCVAGVFSLEDGLRLAAERGRLMQELPEPGTMASAFGSEERVRRAIATVGDGSVSVAALNGGEHVVVSGPEPGVEAVLRVLQGDGVETRRLPVSHAFHSRLMEPVLGPFHRAASGVRLAHPRIDFVSTVSGGFANDEVATPAYWRDQIRRPVRFAEAFAALEARGPVRLIEIGSRPLLLGMARRCSVGSVRAWLPSIDRGREWETILDSLGRLFEDGAPVDWRGFDAPYPRRRVHLPTYPFRRRRCWVDPPSPGDYGRPKPLAPANPLLGRRLALPYSSEIRFESRLSADAVPHLDHHRLFGTMVLAAASDLALFLSAAEAAFGPRPCLLEEVTFERPLVVPDDGARVVQLVMAEHPGEPGARTLRLLSRADAAPAGEAASWTLHVTGLVRLPDDMRTSPEDAPGPPPPEASALDGTAFYQTCWAPGANTGPAFRWIERIWRSGHEAIAHAAPPPGLAEPVDCYPLAPGLIEACFQTLFFAGEFEASNLGEEGVHYVPFTIARFAYYGRPAGAVLWCRARSAEPYAPDAPAKRGDIRLLDEAGRVVAEIGGFEVRRLRRHALDLRPAADGTLCRVIWQGEGPCAPRTSTGEWLIATRDRQAGTRLARALEDRGGCGSVIDPGDALASAERSASTAVVYLAGSGRADLPGLARECGDVLRLIQALAGASDAARLCLVTRSAQRVRHEDTAPGGQRAALWGMARVAAREFPRLVLTCVDIGGDGDLPGVAAELGGGAGEVALRGTQRFVPALEPYHAAEHPSRALLRTDATYVVTDGLSTQGFVVARWLVHHGARHLVLTIAGQPSPDHVAALEGGGAEVRLVPAVPGRPGDTARLTREAWMAMPPLAGVLHLDLPMEDGVIPGLDARALMPALAGSELGWALHDETLGLALDFFVCFSTGAGLLGSGGQCAYAAAGASMDGLAQHRRALGLPGLSIDWGPWAAVGKAAELPEPLARRLRGEGWRPLPTEEGLEILGRLVGGDTPQVGVLPLDWTAYFDTHPAARRAPLLARKANAVAAEPPGPADRAASPLDQVRRLVAQVLGIGSGEVRDDRSLVELGVDSLGALLLANRLRSELGRDVSMAAIMVAPSLPALAAAVERGRLAGPAEREAS